MFRVCELNLFSDKWRQNCLNFLYFRILFFIIQILSIEFPLIFPFFLFTVKPLTVEVQNPPPTLVADRRYEITCESSGSRPNAVITWYKGKRQLRRTKVNRFSRIIQIKLLNQETRKWWSRKISILLIFNEKKIFLTSPFSRTFWMNEKK